MLTIESFKQFTLCVTWADQHTVFFMLHDVFHVACWFLQMRIWKLFELTFIMWRHKRTWVYRYTERKGGMRGGIWSGRMSNAFLISRQTNHVDEEILTKIHATACISCSLFCNGDISVMMNTTANIYITTMASACTTHRQCQAVFNDSEISFWLRQSFSVFVYQLWGTLSTAEQFPHLIEFHLYFEMAVLLTTTRGSIGPESYL